MNLVKGLRNKSQNQSMTTNRVSLREPHGDCAFMHQAVQPPGPGPGFWQNQWARLRDQAARHTG